MNGTECRFCRGYVMFERWEIGYRHCTSSGCVDAWRSERLQEYRLDLVPKQGFAISYISAAISGRSSGK